MQNKTLASTKTGNKIGSFLTKYNFRDMALHEVACMVSWLPLRSPFVLRPSQKNPCTQRFHVKPY